MSAGFKLQQLLHEPEGLAGFLKAFGRKLGNPFTGFCDELKLGPSLTVRLLFRLTPGKLRISLRIADDSVAGDNDCL